ncbi:MAG: protoporphyrinogen oxidase [Myxococcota bacterium]
MTRVGVIGAGVTGLTAALRAQQHGHDVVVFEAQPRAGGAIRSESVDGFLVEHGPASIRGGAPEVRELLAALGLLDRVVTASPDAKRRYLLHGGELVALPGPLGLHRLPMLGAAGAMRIFAEPLVPKGQDEDETVAAFLARRIGPRAADTLGNPLVAGIFAGDPTKLEMASAMPRFWRWEQEEGSLVGGALRATSVAPKGSFTFPGGLAELVAALVGALGDAVRLSDAVTGIEPAGERLRVLHRTGATEVDELVVTADPQVAGRWLPLSPPPIPRAPVVAVHLGYRAEDVPRGLAGFGWLVHAAERRDVLGCLWVSGTFPGHAPAGHHLVRIMAGGARDPQAALLPDEAIVARAQDVLHQVQGIEAPPVMVHVAHALPGIPQYPPGTSRWLRSLRGLPAPYDHAHIRFAGWHYGDIGIADGIRAALTG